MAATGDLAGGRSQDGWVYLPEDFARQHPLYGPHGWALGLQLLLFIGPVALLLQDWDILNTVYRVPAEFYGLIAAELFLTGCAWSAGARLARERESFYPRFWLTALVGLCCGFLFFAVTIEGMPRQYGLLGIQGALERIVPIVIACIYVARSKRLAITCRKRAVARDPFLRAQLLGDQTFEEAAAARPQRPWFFRRATDRMPEGRRQQDATPRPAPAAQRPHPRPLRPPPRRQV